MAFKLTKQEAANKAGATEDLEKAWGELMHAVLIYNREVAALRPPIERAFERYNAVLADAKAIAEEIAKRIEGEFNEKSEKWQESEKGSAASDFKDAWQTIELGEIEPDWPNDLEIEDHDHACELQELPEQAENE